MVEIILFTKNQQSKLSFLVQASLATATTTPNFRLEKVLFPITLRLTPCESLTFHAFPPEVQIEYMYMAYRYVKCLFSLERH